ncbi:MAG TPA: hypothetical protein EYN86_01160 [Planctomycetes bacterium]|jgi:hypothetical protein|nr:hypothetical protein [Planctomycetota bacterium]
MNKPLPTLLLLVTASCSQQADIPASIQPTRTAFDAVISEHLSDASDWPEFDIERANEILDLCDMTALGGTVAQRAQRRLDRLSSDDIQHALLLIVETNKLDALLRRQAYAFLDAQDWQTDNRFIPRLVLRLKYEKDWPSNIIIAQTLARAGNLAGLEAVKSVLLNSDDKRISDLELAKTMAADFIATLNDYAIDFDANWQHLLKLIDNWNSVRGYDLVATEFSEKYQDELWHLVAQFRSQPLRPVDDARFVFIRLEQQAMTVLATAASDNNRYVRDHCLQTLTWMSSTSRVAYDFALADSLAILENDYFSSVRAIEYRGSLMDKEQAKFLWPFITKGNYEQRTAAADALLRCADLSATAIDALVIDERFSPEAQCSLLLLRDELHGNALIPPTIPGLDTNELNRRLRWQQQRQNLAAN